MLYAFQDNHCTVFKTIIVQFSRKTSMTVSRSKWVADKFGCNPKQIWTGLSRGYSLKLVGVLNMTPCPFKKLRGELRVLSEPLVGAEVYWNPLRSTELSSASPMVTHLVLFCFILFHIVLLRFVMFYCVLFALCY